MKDFMTYEFAHKNDSTVIMIVAINEEDARNQLRDLLGDKYELFRLSYVCNS